MRATEFGKKAKELTGADTLDETLTAIEAALQSKEPAPPMGLLLLVDSNGGVWPTILGAHPPNSAKLELLKTALMAYIAQSLEVTINHLKEAEIRAKVKAELDTPPTE